MTRSMRESRIAGLEAMYTACMMYVREGFAVCVFGNQCGMLGVNAKARNTRLHYE